MRNKLVNGHEARSELLRRLSKLLFVYSFVSSQLTDLSSLRANIIYQR